MLLSDELQKSDTTIEAIIVKLADTLKTLLSDYKQMLTVGDSTVTLRQKVWMRI
jgi:hypothetical protein